MAKFTVIGDTPAYGVKPGESFTADEADERVQLNVQAGVITLANDQPKSAGMKCPACVERNKKAPHLAHPSALADHYADEHPALVPPEWKEGV